MFFEHLKILKKTIGTLVGTVVSSVIFFFTAHESYSFSANRIRYELRENNTHRIHINYTVPEMQVSRDVWVEFNDLQEAVEFFNHLKSGGEFFLPHKRTAKIIQNPTGPRPW
jgi:hypothetical protein